MTSQQSKSPPQHTPGPWNASGISVSSEAYPTPYAVIETSDGLNRICNMHSNLDEGTCLANAKLIAAAPELLEALVAVLADAKRRKYSLAGNITDAAHAAIAKSTGAA